MPGLFDNPQAPSGGGGILQGLGGVLSPEIYRQNALEQAYRQNGFDPATARAMAIDPQAASGIMGQRIMQQNYHDLVSSGVPQGLAGMMATHPEMITKLGEIQKLGPGEAPYNALSGMLSGGAPNASQQQTPSSQSAGGSIPGMGPTNMAGAIEPDALKTLVERRLTGDVEAGNEVKAGGISGMNPLNNAAFQKLLTQTMKERGISGTQLARRDAQFPAYKDAVKKNADIGVQMQLAQGEALNMLPLLKQAAVATNPTNYPILNSIKQEYLAQTGDPRSAALASYMNAAVNTYARGITTRLQGATDADKSHIREIVNPYWSKGQWDAGIQAIQNEFNAAHKSLGENRNRIDVQFGFGKDPDPNDVASAKSAIAKGANKENVIRRFENGGFNAPQF